MGRSLLLACLVGVAAGGLVLAACGDEPAAEDEGPSQPPRRRTDAGAEAGEGGASSSSGGLPPDAPRPDRYCEAVLADAPIAYWRFDETSGAVANDERGAYAGAYVGPVTLGRPGLFGGTGAVAFPETSDAHVVVQGDVFRFPDAKPFTIELWVQAAKLDDRQFLGGTEVRDGSGRRGWSLFTANTLGQARFEVWDAADGGGSPVRASTLGMLTLGEYRHVVVTFSGGALRTYLDGKAGSSSNVTPPKLAPNVGVLRWGARAAVGGVADGLDGWAIDEAAVYDYALTPERITAHYAIARP